MLALNNLKKAFLVNFQNRIIEFGICLLLLNKKPYTSVNFPSYNSWMQGGQYIFPNN